MNNETFEQTFIDRALVGKPADFLKEGQSVEILFHAETETPLTVDLPAYVTLEITYTEPGEKGNTATNTFKDATLETGANVKVPLFINTGEFIKEFKHPYRDSYTEFNMQINFGVDLIIDGETLIVGSGSPVSEYLFFNLDVGHFLKSETPNVTDASWRVATTKFSRNLMLSYISSLEEIEFTGVGTDTFTFSELQIVTAVALAYNNRSNKTGGWNE